MSQAQRSAQSFWFGALSAAPRGRLVCGGAALVFLVFPLADLLSGRLPDSAEVAAAAGLAAFAALYLRLLWILPWVHGARRAEGLVLLAAITALATGLSLAFGDEWLGLLVYLAVIAALALPMRLAVGGVLAAAAATLAIDGGAGLALQALMFGLLVVAVRRLVALVEELEAARGQVAQLAVSEERLRLSRDLHDLLGQNLSVIALKSELARRLIGRDRAAAESEIRDIESVARESLQEARDALRGLRRASLAAELDRAREALEAGGIEVTVRTGGPLPAGIEEPLAFAVREATTNVLRHSRASRCELEVRRSLDHAEVEVRDDGTGPADSTSDGTDPADSTSDGSGLRGLAERLARAGGELSAGPAPGGGFALVARVPMPRRATAERPQEGEAVLEAR